MKAIYLKDYQECAYFSPEVELNFDLFDQETYVTAKQKIVRNIKNHSSSPLLLNGVNLQLKEVKIDGVALKQDQYELTDLQLTIKHVPENFFLEVTNVIHPHLNTTCEGLYLSQGIYCTQNEPEGMRRITYFIDRPDNMVSFLVRINANEEKYPTLLSNGDLVEAKKLKDGRHSVLWRDPFKKPSYLFALVAGKLGMIQGDFQTRSGRKIDLRIYADVGKENLCHFALDSLKRAMKWDEDRFDLEYDLNTYMIVAVDAFNMGAMENKGLNIFNASVLYANPETATDDDYHYVEGIVAHEYFHNWTGNRVTCRDWFQLTLKEGLTVFRDQEFSADVHGAALNRVREVDRFIQRQLPEDSGPSSHPIKPKSYIEMNNFYTATVYEKGAEVIRMVQTLLGKENFKKGMAKYFELFDGRAVTTEDFLYAMEQASGVNLEQFRLSWYNKRGTPRLKCSWQQDLKAKKFTLQLEVQDPYAQEHGEFPPYHFPLLIGLIDKAGKEVLAKKLEIKAEKTNFVFENIEKEVFPSLNRRYSAPLILDLPKDLNYFSHISCHDTDELNRWSAFREMHFIQLDQLLKQVQKKVPSNALKVDPLYLKTFQHILEDQNLDLGLKSFTLTMPTEGELLERQFVLDFESTHLVREFLGRYLAENLQEVFLKTYYQVSSLLDREERADQYLQQFVNLRSIKNLALHYLLKFPGQDLVNLSVAQYKNAMNMTEKIEALNAINDVVCEERDMLMNLFYQEFKNDSIVILKWLSLQGSCSVGDAFSRLKSVLKDQAFDLLIPNKVRHLFRSFTSNVTFFHHPSGEGYRLLADVMIELDSKNPAICAGLASSFSKMARLESKQKNLMKREVERILQAPKLSSNTFEILSSINSSVR